MSSFTGSDRAKAECRRFGRPRRRTECRYFKSPSIAAIGKWAGKQALYAHLGTSEETRREWMHFDLAKSLQASLIAARRNAGLTRLELAERSGVSLGTIWRYERFLYEATRARVRRLLDIAAACDCAFNCRFVAWEDFLTREPSDPHPWDADELKRLAA